MNVLYRRTHWTRTQTKWTWLHHWKYKRIFYCDAPLCVQSKYSVQSSAEGSNGRERCIKTSKTWENQPRTSVVRSEYEEQQRQKYSLRPLASVSDLPCSPGAYVTEGRDNYSRLLTTRNGCWTRMSVRPTSYLQGSHTAGAGYLTS